MRLCGIEKSTEGEVEVVTTDSISSGNGVFSKASWIAVSNNSVVSIYMNLTGDDPLAPSFTEEAKEIYTGGDPEALLAADLFPDALTPPLLDLTVLDEGAGEMLLFRNTGILDDDGYLQFIQEGFPFPVGSPQGVVHFERPHSATGDAVMTLAVVSRSQQDCDSSKAKWRGRYSKSKAMEHVIERMHQAERRDQERREQSESDEHAQRKR